MHSKGPVINYRREGLQNGSGRGGGQVKLYGKGGEGSFSHAEGGSQEVLWNVIIGYVE